MSEEMACHDGLFNDLGQEISALGSAILNYSDNKIYVTGFNNKERLLDYVDKGLNCIAFQGIFPSFVIDFSSIADNAHFVLMNDGSEYLRYEFVPLIKDTIKYKDSMNNSKSKVYSVRKCNYTNQFSYKDAEYSQMFDCIDDLKKYFEDRFKKSISSL